MQAFNLDAKNFSDMQANLEPQLEQLKIKQKDILNAELLVEEIFWSIVNKGHLAQVKVQVVKKFFGKVQIKMTAEGAPYNPLVEISDWEEDQDDEDYFSMMILKANRQRLNYLHKNNLNVVTINVRSKGNSQVILTVAGMFAGIICGLLMRELFSPEIISVIDETIIKPCEKMFLNALGLLIAPVIFFSIISAMVGMSSAGVGKVGFKLLGYSMTTGITSLLLSCVASWIFFSDGVPQVNTLPVVESSAESLEFSLTKFIVDIIPDNFVNPILSGNVLQIIFVAILFGIALNKLGNEVSLIRNWVDNLNKIFTSMMTLVIFFVPLIAFFAMVDLALKLNTEIVTLISKLILCQLITIAVMIALYPIFIWRVGKISPKNFFKKVLALLPPAFATASSMVVMPSMMDLCTNKLGISPKISSFSIPIGLIVVNVTGYVTYFVPACVIFMGMYGIELELQNLALVALLSFLLAFGVPSVPAACVICIVTIVSYFGVPNEIAALLFCIDALCDRILTCLNVTSNMMTATVLAHSENLLDEKIYFSS